MRNLRGPFLRAPLKFERSLDRGDSFANGLFLGRGELRRGGAPFRCALAFASSHDESLRVVLR
jgi:hypothetical protein